MSNLSNIVPTVRLNLYSLPCETLSQPIPSRSQFIKKWNISGIAGVFPKGGGGMEKGSHVKCRRSVFFQNCCFSLACFHAFSLLGCIFPGFDLKISHHTQVWPALLESNINKMWIKLLINQNIESSSSIGILTWLDAWYLMHISLYCWLFNYVAFKQDGDVAWKQHNQKVNNTGKYA